MAKGTLFSPSHITSSSSILKRGNKTLGRKLEGWPGIEVVCERKGGNQKT
jgi:hypothetical protein